MLHFITLHISILHVVLEGGGSIGTFLGSTPSLSRFYMKSVHLQAFRRYDYIYWEVQGPGLPYCCQLTSCIITPEGPDNDIRWHVYHLQVFSRLGTDRLLEIHVF